MTVGRALFGQSRRLSGGQVFQPFGGFPRSAGADVNGDVGLRSNLVEEVHEFMCSKRVRLNHAAPVGIERYRSRTANSVAPVVFVCETPAWPANVWHMDRLQRLNDIVANAAGIGDCRVRPDPYPIIDAMSQMLGELAENIAVDLRAGLGHINR